jgi:hypothetical protein
MAKFIKINEYIINLDNVTYIDTEDGDDIDFNFTGGQEISFTRSNKIKSKVMDLLKDEEPKETKKVIE